VPAGQAVEAFFGEHHGKRDGEEEEEDEEMFVAVDIAKKLQMKRSTSVCTFGSGNDGSAKRGESLCT
jgi:hypothetical protein